MNRPRANLTAVAFGLAAMVFLPLIVFSLVPSGLAGTSTRTTGTPVTAQPWFAPVSVEAEASGNQLGGSARVDTYPGASSGRIVRGIGRYGASGQPGTLTVAVTVPAAGQYRLTFYYAHIDGVTVRTVDVSVDGVFTSTVVVTGTAACCTSKSIGISLHAGSNTIVFSNPRAKAPSIDRLVITAS